MTLTPEAATLTTTEAEAYARVSKALEGITFDCPHCLTELTMAGQGALEGTFSYGIGFNIRHNRCPKEPSDRYAEITFSVKPPSGAKP